MSASSMSMVLVTTRSSSSPSKLRRLACSALVLCAVLAALAALMPLKAAAQNCPALPSLNNPFFHVPQPVITQIDPNTSKVRIDAPPVWQPCTSFPQVHFRQFDTVTVSAGGCVQTGGSGRTWKRYVNPSGDNSDRLYHGLIDIPAATSGLERLQTVMTRLPLTVRSIPPGVDPNSLILKLGYEDDNYGDNGYSGHDDGTEDQCKNVGNAFVELTITHHAQPSPSPSPTTPFPMDLTWDEVDNNLLPLNPVWQFRKTHPANVLPDAGALCNHFHDEGDVLKLGNPACTSQSPSVDEPTAGFPIPNPYYFICQADHPAGTVHGHVNWALATFTGTLSFEGWSGNFPQDNDYNLILTRNDEAGVVTGNTHQFGNITALDLEFKSNETIDHFDTPFWSSFHQSVNAGDGQQMLNNLPAITIGLVGIDNQHTESAELHPVLGMAVRVTQSSNEEVWSIFARRSGNEGGCSQDQHAFQQADSMSFLLPTKFLNVGSGTIFRGTGPGTFGVKPVPGGLVLQMDIPQQGDDHVAWGELHLQSTVAGRRESRGELRLASYQDTGSKSGQLSPIHRATPVSPEPDSLAPLLQQLTPGQRQIFQARLASLEAKPTVPSIQMSRDDAKVVIRQRSLPADERHLLVRSPAVLDQNLKTHLANIHQALVMALGSEGQVRQLYQKVSNNGTVVH